MNFYNVNAFMGNLVLIIMSINEKPVYKQKVRIFVILSEYLKFILFK